MLKVLEAPINVVLAVVLVVALLFLRTGINLSCAVIDIAAVLVAFPLMVKDMLYDENNTARHFNDVTYLTNWLRTNWIF